MLVPRTVRTAETLVLPPARMAQFRGLADERKAAASALS